MIISANPIYDYMAYDAQNYKWAKKRPVCCQCGEHIQDEYGYDLNGDWYCEDCINSYRKWIDD